MFNGFMDPSALTTFGGLVTAVIIIVQFSKDYIKLKLGDAYVRLFTLLVSLVLTFIFAPGDWTIKGIALKVINGIIICISSSGAYEIMVDPKAQKVFKDKIKD